MTAKELYEWAIEHDCTEAKLKAIVKDSVYDWDTQEYDYFFFDQYIEPYHLNAKVNLNIENRKGTLKPKLVEEIEIKIEN